MLFGRNTNEIRQCGRDARDFVRGAHDDGSVRPAMLLSAGAAQLAAQTEYFERQMRKVKKIANRIRTVVAESESNDSFASGQTIAGASFTVNANANLHDDSLPTATVNGSLHDSDAPYDVDFYCFNAQAGDSLKHRWSVR